jgi:hypothetical protein
MLESLINFLRIKLNGEKNIKEDILKKNSKFSSSPKHRSVLSK